MNCKTMRELISAASDHEVTPSEQALVERHLRSCASCAEFAARSAEVDKLVRVSAAPDMPDLVAPYVASSRRQAWRPLVLRGLLFVLAVVTIAIALPDMWNASMSAPAHAGRHLGGWDIAFAIGLLLVAVQPSRARGLLPMAAALVGVMIISGLLDAAGGHPTAMPDSSHVIELAQLAALYLLARTQPKPWPSDRRGLRVGPTGPSPSAVRPELHVVASALPRLRARAAQWVA